MATALLSTKLHIPRPRAQLVSRPLLVERLHAGVHRGRKLSLVSAPAGCGKTTLLSEWVCARREAASPAVAWVSLDGGDNDPACFLRYVVAALQAITGPDLGESVLAALGSTPLPPIESLLTALVNEIALQYQGRGIGTALIGDLLAEANEGGVPVRLRVLRTDRPASRLYERLGFRSVTTWLRPRGTLRNRATGR